MFDWFDRLLRFSASARNRGVEPVDVPVLQTCACEYVSGIYLASSRRLLLVGTHFDREGVGFIGLDMYDVQLDGDQAVGITRGNNSQWQGRIGLHAVAGTIEPVPMAFEPI